MKRWQSVLLMLFAAVGVAQAVPALRQWQRHVQPDGTMLTVRLCGDEHFHYYETQDGRRMELQADGELRAVTALQDPFASLYPYEEAAAASPFAAPASPFAVPASVVRQPHRSLQGSRRGILILVEFQDVKFSRPDIKTVYDSICNYRGYTTPPYRGSVRDYFLEQSDEQFDLTLDIVGPVCLPSNESYYGGNGGGLMGGIDGNVHRMALDALQLVADSVDFSTYDWDGDGEADQVFFLYAGYGEAQGGPSWTIWPSEGTLRQHGIYDLPSYGGTTINTFACACELRGYSGQQIDGIGTICHEFSHCLGLPDFYNAADMDDFCMGQYDVMDQGAYNGGSYCPAAYTGLERWLCGWREPVELTEPQTVDRWQPLTEGGATYILYNEGNRSEYYLLDNRQPTGFDSRLYSFGMVVMHVDYDATALANNQVNTNKRRQRCMLVAADNILDWPTVDTDAFPYTYLNGRRTLDSLTNNSHPRTELYNKNRDGSYLLGKPVYNIRTAYDLTMSFSYITRDQSALGIDQPPTAIDHSTLANEHCYDLQGRRVNTASGRRPMFKKTTVNGQPSMVTVLRAKP